MIDSINFKLENVIRLDYERLVKLGIPFYKFIIRQRADKTTYWDWESSNSQDTIISEGYYFSYHNVRFTYTILYSTIIIKANAHQILNKMDVLLSDRDIYISKVQDIVDKVLGVNISELDLHRFDPCVDLKFSNKEMNVRLSLLPYYKNKYKYMTQKQSYPRSKHLTSKYGETNINIYDRYTCEKNKYLNKNNIDINNILDLGEYVSELENQEILLDKYKGIFRIEVQNKKALIKNESDKLASKKDKTAIDMFRLDKDLYGYWNKESMKEFYFDLLKDYLYVGIHYKLKIAYSIIDNKGKDSYKTKLKDFLFYVNRYGITNVIKSKDNKARHKTWSNATVDKYIQMLSDLNINPICLDNDCEFDSLESLYTLAEKVAEEKYFNIDNLEIPEAPKQNNNIPASKFEYKPRKHFDIW